MLQPKCSGLSFFLTENRYSKSTTLQVHAHCSFAFFSDCKHKGQVKFHIINDLTKNKNMTYKLNCSLLQLLFG